MQQRLAGARVVPFDSPRLALNYFAQKKAATLATDLSMTEMDGFAVLQRAKAMRPHVPVIRTVQQRSKSRVG